MRKIMIGAVALAALAAAPSAAYAQAATTTGVAVGDGTGFVLGGPPGAVIGGIIGGSVGANAEPRVHVDEPAHVYVAPRARAGARVYATTPPQRVCWLDSLNRSVCEYR